MNEIGMIILSLIVGFLLGIFFFGGLWYTTKKGVHSKSPALWFMLSLFIRLGITLAGFYFISNGHFERMLICLLGFMIARFIITRYTEIPETNNHR